jgi:imidazolonepropionase-like amidohydrolase
MNIKIRISVLIMSLFITSFLFAQTYQFENGSWLINNKFVSTTVFTENGKFTFQKPTKIDSVINLKNKFCIPPFGDAHTHNLDGAYGLKDMVLKYIKEGVFYVQVLGNNGQGAKNARPVLEKAKLVDATYANGLLTCTYGHGFYPYEPMAMGIYAPYQQIMYADSIKKSRIVENISYFFLDNIADVEKKWDLIMAFKPDLIKICLNDAKNYATKRKIEKPDDNGLSEEVATYVVKKAHQQGLRVFAHIETADDTRLCARIGVDVLAHLPGYGWNGKEETKAKYCITEKDIKLLKKAKITVIPTFNYDGTKSYDATGKETINPANYNASIEYKTTILRLMRKANITIAFGADLYGSTAMPEIDLLTKNNVFPNFDLIDIYSRATPQSIFPKRKIGEIKEGYEASFLVLDENPFNNIQAIKNITLKIRQGLFLNY